MSEGTTDGKTPKRLSLKIIFGMALVCLGVALLLYTYHVFRIWDVVFFLPCGLMVLGLWRMGKKGFFNVVGQIGRASCRERV